jgi:hypothetical protein
VANHQKTNKCERGCEEWTTNRVMTTASTNAVTLEQHEETETPEPREYVFNMPKDQETPCPVRECQYKSNLWGSMWRHFRARHLEDTITIMEEGELPRCKNCGIVQKDVGQKRKMGVECKMATRTREAWKDEQVQKMARNVVFEVAGTPIENINEFLYLG